MSIQQVQAARQAPPPARQQDRRSRPVDLFGVRCGPPEHGLVVRVSAAPVRGHSCHCVQVGRDGWSDTFAHRSSLPLRPFPPADANTARAPVGGIDALFKAVTVIGSIACLATAHQPRQKRTRRAWPSWITMRSDLALLIVCGIRCCRRSSCRGLPVGPADCHGSRICNSIIRFDA
jgi:hypothetical protein